MMDATMAKELVATTEAGTVDTGNQTKAATEMALGVDVGTTG